MTDFVTPPARPRLAIDGDSRSFPVARVFCIGRNYADHAKEMGAKAEAIFFQMTVRYECIICEWSWLPLTTRYPYARPTAFSKASRSKGTVS